MEENRVERIAKLKSLMYIRDTELRERVTASIRSYPEIEAPVYGDTLGDWQSEMEGCKSDVAFLAVDEDCSGFDIARYIHQHFPLTLIIFIGKPEHAFQAFAFEPLDYLSENYSEVHFQNAIYRLKKQRIFPVSMRPISIQEMGGLGYRSNGAFHKLYFSDILYIERVNRKIIFHTVSGDIEMAKYSLNFLESTLSCAGFYRVHQSFLVNFNRIKSLRQCDSKDTYELILDGSNTVIPVSRDKAHLLFDALGNHILVL